jgi:pyruvate,water dikinase
MALSTALLEGVAAGDERALALASSLLAGGATFAVRSSAVGEDGASASFAGQHATILGVHDDRGLLDALRRVHASARGVAALAYRARLGVTGVPRIGAVVQQLVRADVAGVLFTRNPVTGADERVIEGSWGLGESVVAGLVTPDRARVTRAGAILERTAGEKDVMIVCTDDGGTREEPVAAHRIASQCLDDARIRALHALASRCEELFGADQDIEWAFAGERLYLLQSRAITRAR